MRWNSPSAQGMNAGGGVVVTGYPMTPIVQQHSPQGWTYEIERTKFACGNQILSAVDETYSYATGTTVQAGAPSKWALGFGDTASVVTTATGTAASNSATNYAGAYRVDAGSYADGEIRFTIAKLYTTNGAELYGVYRATNTGTANAPTAGYQGYQILITNAAGVGKFSLLRAGGTVIFPQTTYQFAVGDVVVVRFVGSYHTIFVIPGGTGYPVMLAQVFDSTYTAGWVGTEIRGTSFNSELDDFGYINYAAVAPVAKSGGATSVASGGGSLPAATFDQVHFRFRNDDGSETTATWLAALDTGITLPVETTVRLRIALQAGTINPPSEGIQFQYRKNGGAWLAVAGGGLTTDAAAMVDSANFVAQDGTTQQITSGGTFVAGRMLDTGPNTLAIDAPASGFTEIEAAFKIVTSQATNGDVIDFRMVTYTPDTLTTTLTQLPSITVGVAAITKSGGGVSPASAGGTSAIRYAKSGGATSVASAGGTRAYSVGRASGAISVASANGTRAYRIARASGAVSVASANGTKNVLQSFAKTAGAISVASANGTRTYRVARSSGAVSVASANGTKNVLQTFAKTAGAISIASAGATRAYKVARSSGAISVASAGGTGIKTILFPRSGGAISVASANGTRAYLVARSSGAISVASASGSKAFSAVKSAGATSVASGGGTRLIRVARSAGAVSVASAGGTKNVLTTGVKTGGAISVASASGTRTYRVARSAGAVSVASAGGTGIKTTLFPRSGGAISVGSAGGTRAYRIARSSGAVSVASAGATKAARFVKSAGAISVATANGTRGGVTLVQKSGGAISVGSSGATRATRYVKSFGAVSTASANGTRGIRYTKSNGAISIGSGGGTRTSRANKLGGGLATATGGGTNFIRVLFVRNGGAISIATAGGTKNVFGGFSTKLGGAVSIATGGGTVHIGIPIPPGADGNLLVVGPQGTELIAAKSSNSTLLPIETTTSTIGASRERAVLLSADEKTDSEIISTKV